jgi:hypothetical protein
MRSFGEMADEARHSYKNNRNKLAHQGYTVMFIGYSNIHEKDVHHFTIIATKNTLFYIDVIWFIKPTYKTWEQHKVFSSQVKWKKDKLMKKRKLNRKDRTTLDNPKPSPSMSILYKAWIYLLLPKPHQLYRELSILIF